MSALFSLNSSAREGFDLSHQSTTIYPMGDGYRGGLASSSRERKLFVSYNGLLHEMGKNRTTGPNKGDGCDQII